MDGCVNCGKRRAPGSAYCSFDCYYAMNPTPCQCFYACGDGRECYATGGRQIGDVASCLQYRPLETGTP